MNTKLAFSRAVLALILVIISACSLSINENKNIDWVVFNYGDTSEGDERIIYAKELFNTDATSLFLVALSEKGHERIIGHCLSSDVCIVLLHKDPNTKLNFYSAIGTTTQGQDVIFCKMLPRSVQPPQLFDDCLQEFLEINKVGT